MSDNHTSQTDSTSPLFVSEQIASGVHRIVDVLGNHCYLVEGTKRALLVDSCGGFGDLSSVVRKLTSLPVTVVLTHGHEDHMMGSYWFEEAHLSPLDGGALVWEQSEERTQRIYDQIVAEGIVSKEAAFAVRDGHRPRETSVADGDVFDLGGRTVVAVALPGHTAGSFGYLVDDFRILFSGDAVTPVMCLFFEESLSIQDWREKTLARMMELPLDVFYTGHHDHAFNRDDLPSFDSAGAFAIEDRGMPWEHNRLHEFRGIIHLCPCETFDADSVDFRAVIDRWHELPPRKKRRRKRAE